MIQVQRYSAARAGEVCMLRPADLDVSCKVWLYRARMHKNAKCGQGRIIYHGGKAREAIVPLLAGCALDKPLCDPRESAHGRARANVRQGGKRSENLEQNDRRSDRRMQDCYTTKAYHWAGMRSCEAAGVSRWTTRQLRNLAVPNARKAFGAEAAAPVLGGKGVWLVKVFAEK